MQIKIKRQNIDDPNTDLIPQSLDYGEIAVNSLGVLFSADYGKEVYTQIGKNNSPVYPCDFGELSPGSTDFGIVPYVPVLSSKQNVTKYFQSLAVFESTTVLFSFRPDNAYNTRYTYNLMTVTPDAQPGEKYPLEIVDVQGKPLKDGAWSAEQIVVLGMHGLAGATTTKPTKAILIGGASSGGTVTQSFTGSTAGTAAPVNADTLNGQPPDYYRSQTFSATIPVASWTGTEAPYQATVALSTVTIDTIIQNIYIPSTASATQNIDLQRNLSYINAVETKAGELVFHCYYTKPDIDMTVECVWVK